MYRYQEIRVFWGVWDWIEAGNERSAPLLQGASAKRQRRASVLGAAQKLARQAVKRGCISLRMRENANLPERLHETLE